MAVGCDEGDLGPALEVEVVMERAEVAVVYDWAAAAAAANWAEVVLVTVGVRAVVVGALVYVWALRKAERKLAKKGRLEAVGRVGIFSFLLFLFLLLLFGCESWFLFGGGKGFKREVRAAGSFIRLWMLDLFGFGAWAKACFVPERILRFGIGG